MATRELKVTRPGGREYRLTKTQVDYLKEMRWHDRLQQGWGGYSSTQVVRRLEELGLISLQRWPNRNGGESWTAKINGSGRVLLDEAEL